MDTETFKAILTFRRDGELVWAFDDFKSWSEVREEAGQLLVESSGTSSDIDISAVSNQGDSLEISKEESINDM